jgi:hypothetical protein
MTGKTKYIFYSLLTLPKPIQTMCKYHVEYSVRTKQFTKSFSLALSSPSGDNLEEFIVNNLGLKKVPCLVSITSIKPLAEEDWKEMYVKSLI